MLHSTFATWAQSKGSCVQIVTEALSLPHGSYLSSLVPNAKSPDTEAGYTITSPFHLTHNSYLSTSRFTMRLLNVDTKVAQVELLTDYTFTNKVLVAEAVQMAAPKVAVVYQSSFRGLPNNKRLSVLGDAVLTKVLCGHWFSARDWHGTIAFQLSFDVRLTMSGKELNASDWTTLREDMLSNDNLARRGYHYGIGALVYCNVGTVVSAKMVASTLEAIIGAVYRDGGDTAVLQVIRHLGFFEHRLLMVTLHPSHHPT